MSDTSTIRIKLETDLLDLQGLLKAMHYTLSDEYWSNNPDGQARHATMRVLISYAQGLCDEIEEATEKLFYKQAAPCESQIQETEEGRAGK